VLNSLAAAAQAALESGWGNSELASRHANLFGIKASSGWKGEVAWLWTREWDGLRYVRVLAPWRRYPSWSACLVDYAALIQGLWWFRDALPYADPPHGSGDASGWIAALVDRSQAGERVWATSPDYWARVMRIAAEIEGMPEMEGRVRSELEAVRRVVGILGSRWGWLGRRLAEAVTEEAVCAAWRALGGTDEERAARLREAAEAFERIGRGC